MKDIQITSKIVGRKSDGRTGAVAVGAATVNMSGYLSKSEWNEVFEVKVDKNGTSYLSVKKHIASLLGLTMYRKDEGVDIPSIYDGLPIDGVTIYWEDGILKSAVSTGGGGVADSVAWVNITGKPNFAKVATSGQYNDLSGKPTLISSFANDIGYITSSALSDYLPKSGGIITGLLKLQYDNSRIAFYNAGGTHYGNIGFYQYKPSIYLYNMWREIIHEGNYKSYVPTLIGTGASGTWGINVNGWSAMIKSYDDTSLDVNGLRCYYGTIAKGESVDGSWSSPDGAYSGQDYGSILRIIASKTYYTDIFLNANASAIKYRQVISSVSKGWKEIATTDGNVASATKLKTSRTIWGQPFDGSANVEGEMVVISDKADLLTLKRKAKYGAYVKFFGVNQEVVGWRVGVAEDHTFRVMYSDNSFSSFDSRLTISQTGDLLVRGAITMNSMRSLKDIVDERGLSLEELGSIKPTRFRWKDGRDDRIHIGGIADDVMGVLPEVVFRGGDGVLSMDYGCAAFAIGASLIKPVSEHERRIAALERENKKLKDEINGLKNGNH